MRQVQLGKLGAILGLLFLVNTAYVAAFASPTIPYMTNVLLHFLGGLVLSLGFGAALLRQPPLLRRLRVASLLFGIALASGVFLAWAGNLRAHRGVLVAHVLVGSVGLVALLPFLRARALALGGGHARLARAYAAALGLLALAPLVTHLAERLLPDPRNVIQNPRLTPASMQHEGGGPTSPFWPSSARTNVGGIIPSDFFMDSENCGRCHTDIYEQWNSSAHHFASFNNQFYRASIEYMQDVAGTQPSKWCAGCHDHAVFFNGRFERPIKEQIDTPQAHAGLSCTSCHSISQVHGTMGQGDFTIEYPPLHELASSRNPLIRTADTFLTYLDPEPHRRTFLKPFMKDSSEFCSACHKVHLDVPVNNYRWFRGFNDYDNWQASAVSGHGARSFYYPAKSKTCAGCHMPLVASNDPGNREGKVHSHRFAAANMALAYVNRDEKQMQAVRDFLQSGIVTVDVFAATPVNATGGDAHMVRRGDEGPQLMSSFAVGEEAESGGSAVIRDVGAVAAPLDRAQPVLRPGSTARVDVVVRTRGVGHFFPGGTVDAFDVWLELKAEDAAGRTIFWSGRVEDEGRGAVEPGAHFYRSLLLDAEGHPINKRNAWQARSAFYVRLIPPGAADVAHFRVRIPEDAQGPLKLTAKLNYRKFSHYYTRFAYAGRPKPGQDPKLLDVHSNGLEYDFDPAGIPGNVSGKIKDQIPDLPIVVVARAEARLPLGPGETVWRSQVERADWERWNDWGIGLLQQGDLKGAEYAFKKATEADPQQADGWLNVGRTLIREGESEAARPFVERALRLKPGLPRALFFGALIDKAAGDYDGALAALDAVLRAHPKDRVVLNQAARLLFLKRSYARALEYLERVAQIDPEDVQMHYTRLLCYRGLGDEARAAEATVLFKRFKADESSQSITARHRQASPEDNNERQQIHDHDSVPLDEPIRARRASRG